ncbi:MAG: right-handed parallel beta-helix repeat-containing protein [Proteobacteria bacterium]|nr:right-handed parallel beta-helix repeat-containing protein [Pseudomonadota bacterium]
MQISLRNRASAYRCLGAVAGLALVAGLAQAHTAPRLSAPVTWYVRADGGDATQCNGRVDRAWPGRGKHLACAWSSPMIALPPPPTYGATAVPRMRGGDTLLIGPGQYMIGFGGPGAGSCTSSSAYACTMAPVPSGPSAQRPTRILGADCKAPPQLWGTQRAYAVLDLTGSSNVEVGCLEITDHSSCIENHCATEGACKGEIARCERERYPYGPWAENGLVASDSHDVALHDLAIHGLANDGVRAGRLTDWTVERVRIVGNGFAGWDGDISNGDRKADTSNHGTLAFRHVEIGYNGCGERYPGLQIFGCWGQEEGGYGDGLGTGRTGGKWVFEDVYAHHNTQDGLDLLYADGSGSVTMNRVRAEGNAGNQLKVSGTALIENSQVNGNCAYFSDAQHVGAGDMQGSDACRAAGDAIAVGLIDGKTTQIRNNTITGQGGCLITGARGGPTAILKIVDNTLTGQPRWDDPTRLACAWYLYESKGTIQASGNRLRNVKQTAAALASCPDAAAHPRLHEACRAAQVLLRDTDGD